VKYTGKHASILDAGRRLFAPRLSLFAGKSPLLASRHSLFARNGHNLGMGSCQRGNSESVMRQAKTGDPETSERRKANSGSKKADPRGRVSVGRQ
jgi:hypothetical protein